MTDPSGTRILEQGGARTLVRRRASLEVIAGPDAGRSIELQDSSLRVGSGDAELVLADDAISSTHFEVLVDAEGWRLRDLGSTNGTRVNGLRARDVDLVDGVEIAAGRTALRFTTHGDDVEVPLSRRTNFGELLGHSPVMQAAFAILERAAKSDATVLILGESGTGKELAARGVHAGSARKGEPFVVFDCGAATPSLLESQLFGHVRGAFTGADQAREGVFEAADGGTLVLDELGELPLELQPKLLRALEQRAVTPVGATAPRPFDVRFVACTNRNLREEVRAGRFREDLFFRLCVLEVRLPPLRERVEEIPRLVRAFLAARGVEGDPPAGTFALLAAHRWPGNVRELRNVVERMVALPDMDATVWLPDASADGDPGGDGPREAQAAVKRALLERPFHAAKQEWIDRFERAYLERLIEAHEGNVSQAARESGLSRQTCYRLLQKHGLS